MTAVKIKPFLPYIGIPFVCGALLLIWADVTDPFTILRFEIITIIGYIVAIHDLKTKRIPNSIILTMFAAWIILMVPKLFFDTDAALSLLVDSALGFALGGGIFILTYIISRKGVGGGDVKFMAAAGIYLGFSGTVSVILFGSVLAALTGLTLIALKKIGRKDSIPLAPFLFIGMLITMFFK